MHVHAPFTIYAPTNHIPCHAMPGQARPDKTTPDQHTHSWQGQKRPPPKGWLPVIGRPAEGLDVWAERCLRPFGPFGSEVDVLSGSSGIAYRCKRLARNPRRPRRAPLSTAAALWSRCATRVWSRRVSGREPSHSDMDFTWLGPTRAICDGSLLETRLLQTHLSAA